MNYDQLSKFFVGELTPEEKESLLTSLGNDEKQLEEAAKLKNSWAAAQLTTSVAVDKQTAQKGLRRLQAGISRQKNLILTRWQVAVAAAVAGIIFAASFYAGQFANRPKPVEIAYHTLSVPAGQYAQLTLADGSEIWLNARSKLVYPERFTSGVREVWLEGEGLFSVVSDSERPFVVKTGGIDIAATGTELNVSAYDDDDWAAVTLIEGVVNLISSDNGIDYALKPGHIAVYDKASFHISEQQIDTDIHTSWTHGEYRFKEMELADIVKRLERYYDFRFVFLDEALKQRKFSGSFYNNQSIETIVRIIEMSTNMNCRVEEGVVYFN
jgi:ferric-dicitrate binding protein FerR (iron transport regulator)